MRLHSLQGETSIQESNLLIVKVKNGLENKDCLKDKEVFVKLKGGGVIDGIVREVKLDSILLSNRKGWEDKVEVKIENIINLESSEHPYFSMKHKRELREQKIPSPSFRFSEDELNTLEGKYVFVNYDGKLIDGNIVKVKFVSNGINSIIVRSTKTNEAITIEDYRLRDLEITGSTLNEHEKAHVLRELESKLYLINEDFISGSADELRNKEVNPDKLASEYFVSKLSSMKGENVELNRFEYLWTNEVLSKSNKSSHKTNVYDKILNEDLKKARAVNEYYESRKAFIDSIFKEVGKIDWTKYFKAQKDGEIEALEYLYESDILMT